MNKALFIVGPTASGKTLLALDLAEKFDGEIINADSRAFYKGMNILTAKPSNRERKMIPHHLIDIRNPDQIISLAEFAELAREQIKNIQQRGKTPIIVGGSALYIYALLYGYQIPKISPDIKLRMKLEKISNDVLFKKLKKLDPYTAKKIDPKNKRRLIRALEVNLSTGKSFFKERKRVPIDKDSLIIGIKITPAKLQSNISIRTKSMFNKKLFDEVRSLSQKYDFKLPSFSAIGYTETKKYMDGKISREEAIDEIVKRTVKFSKRQLTWFKKNSDIVWVSSKRDAIQLVKKFLSG